MRKGSSQFQSYTYTNKHHALLYNLPAKVENGFDRKRGKKVIISSPTHTQTNIMHFCTTHHLKFIMDWTRNKKRKWSFLLLHTCAHTHTHTHKHHALLQNSLAKVENILHRKRGKKVVTSSPTHIHTNIMHFCTTHQLKLRMDWTGNREQKQSFLVLHIHTQTSCTSVQLTT